MKHAGNATLSALRPLLDQLRGLPGLVERKPGIFYVKGQAYLHFHDDPAGVFADVRLGASAFERLPASTPIEWQALLRRIQAHRHGGGS